MNRVIPVRSLERVFSMKDVENYIHHGPVRKDFIKYTCTPPMFKSGERNTPD